MKKIIGLLLATISLILVSPYYSLFVNHLAESIIEQLFWGVWLLAIGSLIGRILYAYPKKPLPMILYIIVYASAFVPALVFCMTIQTSSVWGAMALAFALNSFLTRSILITFISISFCLFYGMFKQNQSTKSVGWIKLLLFALLTIIVNTVILVLSVFPTLIMNVQKIIVSPFFLVVYSTVSVFLNSVFINSFKKRKIGLWLFFPSYALGIWGGLEVANLLWSDRYGYLVLLNAFLPAVLSIIINSIAQRKRKRINEGNQTIT